jgi:2-dehydro-3-deoxyphosphogluconate aldolase / (4S)-4-hydroxy-2-oxoglutarate aldolase
MTESGTRTTAPDEAEIIARLKAAGAIPVLSLNDMTTAHRVAGILLAESLPAIEVTFRTGAAAEIIAGLRRSHPALLVGAGTLLSPGQVEAAVAAGAQFGVSPGLTGAVLRSARALGLPFMPGVATPTEIERGLGHGLKLLKWFPAEPLGGPRGLAQAAAPYLHTGLRFMPSGGVTGETAAAYLALPYVLAVGGSWMIPGAALASGDWRALTEAVRAAVALLRESRG